MNKEGHLSCYDYLVHKKYMHWRKGVLQKLLSESYIYSLVQADMNSVHTSVKPVGCMSLVEEVTLIGEL